MYIALTVRTYFKLKKKQEVVKCSSGIDFFDCIQSLYDECTIVHLKHTLFFTVH